MELEEPQERQAFPVDKEIILFFLQSHHSAVVAAARTTMAVHCRPEDQVAARFKRVAIPQVAEPQGRVMLAARIRVMSLVAAVEHHPLEAMLKLVSRVAMEARVRHLLFLERL